eukprot:XP_001710179.1 Hypothetical protein GL50803_27712 [Giardia lamblia ATCC 50803]
MHCTARAFTGAIFDSNRSLSFYCPIILIEILWLELLAEEDLAT